LGLRATLSAEIATILATRPKTITKHQKNIFAIRLNEELLMKGAKSSLTIVAGADHEDPAFGLLVHGIAITDHGRFTHQ
jgi:hypothetical protein